MLLLPVPVAVDCLSSLAVSMGATKAVRLLGHVKTDGSLEKVGSVADFFVIPMLVKTRKISRHLVIRARFMPASYANR